MAINPINAPAGRAKESTLDKILKGLQIAESVFKIPVAYKQLEAYGAESDLKKQDLATKQRHEKLTFTPVEVAQSKLLPAKPEDKEAFDINLLLPSGETQPLRVKAGADLDRLVKEVELLKGMNDLKTAPQKAESARLENQIKLENLKTPSQAQSQAAVYARRMESAHKIVEDLGDFDPAEVSIRRTSKELLPEKVGNLIATAPMQQYDQAQRNFVSGVLRKESGANIPPKELAEEVKKYFPQIGDSPEVIAQKTQTRIQAIEGMKAEAGKAYAQVPAVPAQPVKYKKQADGLIPEAKAQPNKSLIRPKQVDPKDWAKATNYEKEQLVNHFEGQ